MSASARPIFILGVPRSGTTLLRTLLDSHPRIAAGPETPWLCAHQPRSLQSLWEFLREERLGYCASFGMGQEAVTAACRRLVEELLGAYAAARGKARWAEKTPNNALFLDFLLELFPDAHYIVMTRDPLDTVASTCCPGPQCRGVSPWHERHLTLGPRLAVPNTPFNALVRWRHWNRLIRQALAGRPHLHVRYEDLVARPRSTLGEVCEFVGESFDQGMLEYMRRPHEFPDWEWGSADVVAAGRITASRIGRARRDLAPATLELLTPLAFPSGTIDDLEPASAFCPPSGPLPPAYSQFVECLDALARPLGLATSASPEQAWAWAWLWFNVLARCDLSDVRMLYAGSPRTPIPWLAALLGARVTMLMRHAGHQSLCTTLCDQLRAHVAWHLAADAPVPLPAGTFDLAVLTATLDDAPDTDGCSPDDSHRRHVPADVLITEMARSLRAGGMLALACHAATVTARESRETADRGENRPLLMELERAGWQHPAFSNGTPPPWTSQPSLQPSTGQHSGHAVLGHIGAAAALLRRSVAPAARSLDSPAVHSRSPCVPSRPRDDT